MHTSCTCNNMKTYTISRKKFKERNKKIKVKILNAFLSFKIRFLVLKMAVTA
jgi:hypothetical protein